MSPLNNQRKKISLVAIFLVVASLAVPTVAVKAQFIVNDAPYAVERQVNRVKSGIEKSLSFVFFQAVMNSVNYFLQKAAYDTAVWVASGGKAKVPLFDRRTVGQYLQDTSLDAAGEFIGTFSKAGIWQNLGLDLCSPSLPQIKLKIHLGAINTLEPKPKCAFNQIKQNYSRLVTELDNGELLNRVGIQFTGGGESELGTALAFNLGLQQHISDKQTTAELDRLINKGYRAVTTPFGNKVTTPADVVEQYAKQNVKNPQAEAEFKATQAFLNKDVLLGSLQLVGNMFVQTLAGKLLSRAKNGFFSVNDIVGSEKKSLRDIVGSFGAPKGTQKAAEELYADLLEPVILDVAQYNPLNEYANCPEEFRGKTFKTINSCVLDQAFLQAIEQKLTIGEAVERGLLHGAWSLVPPSVNQDAFCYKNAYCSGNLAKLRKLRVVPVGFELAAEVTGNISGGGKPATLATVLAEFNTLTSPFYHLLDENWILKFPETQCRKQVYGATLAGWDASEREEVCVDTPSCLSTDSNGKCTGGFGYCTREQNIWAIPGEQCPVQFASCRSYTRTTGEEVNYLSNTLDVSSCTAANAGCLAYRTTQDTTGAWSGSEKLFLNGNAETCDLGSVGCSKLARVDSLAATNLLPNGGFEDDSDLNNLPDGWTLGGASYVNNNSLAYEGNDSVLLNISEDVIHDKLPVFSNEVYTLLFFVRHLSSASTQSVVSVNITYLDQAGATLGNSQKNLVVDTQYKPLTFAFTTLPTATKIEVRVLNTTGPDVRLDGTFLTRGNTYGDVSFAYLKKAPDYLGCTGESGEPAPCVQYANACLKSEVGCQLYEPKDGTPSIPGSVSPEDFCPAECVGYSAFSQQKSNFENTNVDQYLIPDTAKQCAVANVGCSAFTNLSNEKVEHFSFVRACQKDETNADIYYTWEGSDTTGFQLKTWKLKKDSGSPAGPFVSAGGVCQLGDIGTNPDCREFLDQTGNKFYRLYSKTTVVSADCTAYRKTEFLGTSPTNTEIKICTDTGGTFDSTTNGCVYNGLPSENISCPKEENNCRAFSGTISGNVRQVFSTNFENGLDSWSGGALSNESLTVGGHSLRLANETVNKTLTNLVPGMSYTVTFWARGVSALTNIQILLFGKSNSVSITQLWKPYTVGPFVAGANNATAGVFAQSIAGTVYLDTITLTERQSALYAIANSWATPASCDAPVPQAHLGCSEYRVKTSASSGPANQTAYLKSFTNLCRPEKVGCTAFIDTKNSPSLNSQTFNAVCQLSGVATTDTPCNDSNGNLLCTVNASNSSCRYNTADSANLPSCVSSGAGACRDESTFTNQADSYVYLVDDRSKSCNEDKAGCMLLGQEAIDSANTQKGVSVKINTENFGNQLCLAEAVACEEYRTADSVAYFKNPGSKLCEWKENLQVNSSTKVTGWFRKGTQNPPLPCNPTRFINNTYQISRNADFDYAGLVGMCAAQYDQCTEFVDPADVSAQNPAGKSYYYIKNDRINAGDCGGQVSQKEGCVLFNDTSNLDLNFNAIISNLESEAAQNRKVDAIGCGGGPGGSLNCDSNTIIKVAQDRQCGEWLACETKASIWDSNSGRFRDICLSVAPCLKSITTAQGSECVEFASRGGGLPLKADIYSARDVNFSGLDYSGYSIPNIYPIGDLNIVNVSKTATTDWRLVNELSGTTSCSGVADGNGCATIVLGGGTSQPGMCFNNRCLAYIDGSLPENVSTSGGKEKPFKDSAKSPENICRGYPEKDSPFSQRVAPSGPIGESRLPGFANATICLQGNCECVYQKVSLASDQKYYSFGYFDGTKYSCRGGTRNSLPCNPAIVVTDPNNGCPVDPVNKSVGKCVRALPNNLCSGGARDGQACSLDIKSSCPKDIYGNEGTCEKVDKVVEYAGLYGRCVERDRTTLLNGASDQFACLTWYPTDLSMGGLDIYNLNKVAIYVPAISEDRIRDLGADRTDYNYNVYLGILNGRAKDAFPANANQNNVAIASALCQGDKCRFGNFSRLAIDGAEASTVTLSANTVKTSKLEFYSWADNDQTPIREVKIIWGDGTEDVLTNGLYKNHKPYCNADDFSQDGGAGYCHANLTTAESLDTNYTCNQNTECSIFKPTYQEASCKKEKVCQKNPLAYCVPGKDDDGDPGNGEACKTADLGSCGSNTNSKQCKILVKGEYVSPQLGDPSGLEKPCGDQADGDTYCRGAVYSKYSADAKCEEVEGQPAYICSKSEPGGGKVECSGAGDTICSGQSTGPCVDQRFNGSSIRVCESNPFRYIHTYQCDKTSGTCSFSVSVKVTDNIGNSRTVPVSFGAPIGGGGVFGP